MIMTVEQQFGVSMEQLKASDVMGKQPDKEAADLEKKIKAARKGATLQIKLSADEVQQITSQALKAGYSKWKEYCTAEIQSKVLNQFVGSPKITGPSTSRGGPIKGPSDKQSKRTGDAGF